MRQQQDPTSATRWLPVYNTESIPVPPFAVMRTTGIDSDGVYQVAQPNADSMTEVLINGPVSIPPLTKGSGHRTDPAQVLIETIDGMPAVGNDYGTEASNWKLRKNKTGFRVLGSVGDSTIEATFYGSSYKRLLDTVSGTLTVQESSGGPVIVTPADTITFNNSGGNFSVYDNGGGEAIVSAVAATTSLEGVVTTVAQDFAGRKSFNQGIDITGWGAFNTYLSFGGVDLTSKSYMRVVDTAGVYRFEHFVIPRAGYNDVASVTFGETNASEITFYLTLSGSNYGTETPAFGIEANGVFYRGGSATLAGMVFVGGIYTSGSFSGYVPGGTDVAVADGGTGRSTLDSGQLIAGNGTSAVDSLSGTRVVSETVELKIASDRWIAFSKGSF